MYQVRMLLISIVFGLGIVGWTLVILLSPLFGKAYNRSRIMFMVNQTVNMYKILGHMSKYMSFAEMRGDFGRRMLNAMLPEVISGREVAGPATCDLITDFCKDIRSKEWADKICTLEGTAFYSTKRNWWNRNNKPNAYINRAYGDLSVMAEVRYF